MTMRKMNPKIKLKEKRKITVKYSHDKKYTSVSANKKSEQKNNNRKITIYLIRLI